MIIRALLLCLISFSHLASAELETRIIELNNPETIYQTISDLYGDYVKINLNQHRLIIRGQTKQLDQITQIIEDIDRPKLLKISLSSKPQNDTLISTRSKNEITQVPSENGKQFAINRSHIQEGGYTSWYQSSSDDTVIDDETILITPLLIANGVRIQMTYNKKQNAKIVSSSQTLIGKVGEWISLTGKPDNVNKQRISTSSKEDELWIKIDSNK